MPTAHVQHLFVRDQNRTKRMLGSSNAIAISSKYSHKWQHNIELDSIFKIQLMYVINFLQGNPQYCELNSVII